MLVEMGGIKAGVLRSLLQVPAGGTGEEVSKGGKMKGDGQCCF